MDDRFAPDLGRRDQLLRVLKADIASEDSGGRGCALKPRPVDQIEDRIGLAARHRLAELDAAVRLDQTEQGLRRTSTPRSRRSWPLPRRADFLE
ncbi:hypothetical protein X772_16465 [Mesorhizobium sp. LSJC280B00]|nr:hypothetical protein X772_16465 [Mesorhizobium sp. LSJC280B00]